MRRARGRDRCEGSASIELLGLLPFLLLAVLAVVQICLAAATVVSADAAARAAARTASRGGSTAEVAGSAQNAIQQWLATGVNVSESGEQVQVEVDIPILLPGLHTKSFSVTRAVVFPSRT